MTSTYHKTAGTTIRCDKDSAAISMRAVRVSFDVTSDLDGVHVARDGVLHISYSGDRDPDTRHIYVSDYGVGCDLASEFAGRLVCPHTGKDVKVSRIADNPVLWLDYEHGIAVKNYQLQYATPTSPPTFVPTDYTQGMDVMLYSFSNQKRYAAFKKHWLALQPEAQLRYELMVEPQISWPSHKVKELVLDHPEATTLEQLCDIAKGINGFNLDDLLCMYQVIMVLKTYQINDDAAKTLCADKYETTYFKIKE
jgi:hypothetical protein